MATGGEKFLFIEGTSDTANGNLREGFSRLLSQKLKGKMPKIRMGDSTNNAVNKFKNCKQGYPLLLIDLDSIEAERENVLKKHELKENEDVFFMIQEMESWFLSQPDILDEFYGESISKEIRSKNAKEIPEPDKYLKSLTKHTKKGQYHKVKHGVELLKRLDAVKLEAYFSDFADLIKKISNE